MRCTRLLPRALLITDSVAMETAYGNRLDRPMANPQSPSHCCNTKGGIRC